MSQAVGAVPEEATDPAVPAEEWLGNHVTKAVSIKLKLSLRGQIGIGAESSHASTRRLTKEYFTSTLKRMTPDNNVRALLKCKYDDQVKQDAKVGGINVGKLVPKLFANALVPDEVNQA